MTNATLRILHVEHSAADARLVKEELRRWRRDLIVERVDEAPAMRAALAAGSWDLILSDWSLPKFSGTAAIAIAKAAGMHAPFLIVSGTSGEDTAVEAMRAGAHDFILKDRLSRLVPAVERVMRELESVSARYRLEARNASILAMSFDAIVAIDHEGTITEWNPAATRMFGYARDQALGRSLGDLVIPAASRQAHRDGMARFLVSGESRMVGRRIVLTALRASGEEFAVEISVARAGTQEPPSFVGFIRDIQERLLVEEARRQSEARFRCLAESGIIGICVSDRDGRFLEANDAFLAMVGYTRDDLREQKLSFRAMSPPGSDAQNAAVSEELRRRGSAAPREREYVRKDGSVVSVLVGFTSLGRTEAICFVVDLTSKKQVEQELRQTEAQLRQAQKMDAVGRLAGGVAHDFNNMLSVVLSYATLIHGELDPKDPVRADVEQILEAGRRTSEVTKQLLMFSRQQVLDSRVCDLN
jgi:PAS domain S-box-containing protein